ncbi:MAG: NAD(P)/FAD-dependent oxidoreductase, partial [Thermodesulfobacteriota bacterium]
LKGLQPEAYLINYDYRGSRFGKVHLVGDAAGLASPLTGEGIYPAILSGRAAAAAILADRSPEPALAGLLAKHRLHLRYQRLASVNRLFGLLTGELFTALLRAGLKEFSSLEMGT